MMVRAARVIVMGVLGAHVVAMFFLLYVVGR